MSRRGAPPSFASKGMFDVLSADDDERDDDDQEQHDEQDEQVSTSKSEQSVRLVHFAPSTSCSDESPLVAPPTRHLNSLRLSCPNQLENVWQEQPPRLPMKRTW